MGIYPSYTKSLARITDGGGEAWTEYRSTPGLVEERTVTVSAWAVKERTNCYCCSCGDREGSDPYCRNHNYGFGMRPCDRHKMPGEKSIDPDTEKEYAMPDSVQVHLDKVEHPGRRSH